MQSQKRRKFTAMPVDKIYLQGKTAVQTEHSGTSDGFP